MKLTTFLSTLLAAAAPINTAAQDLAAPKHEFTFDLSSIFPGAANVSAFYHVNLTGVDNTTFTGLGPGQLAHQNHALMDVLEHQIPAFIQTYLDVIEVKGQTCDLTCCEEACFAIIWFPLGTLICIAACHLKYGA